MTRRFRKYKKVDFENWWVTSLLHTTRNFKEKGKKNEKNMSFNLPVIFIKELYLLEEKRYNVIINVFFQIYQTHCIRICA